eukprot:3140010-Rhodomonas_salina.3
MSGTDIACCRPMSSTAIAHCSITSGTDILLSQHQCTDIWSHFGTRDPPEEDADLEKSRRPDGTKTGWDRYKSSAKSNSRSHIPGTTCTEIPVVCI